MEKKGYKVFLMKKKGCKVVEEQYVSRIGQREYQLCCWEYEKRHSHYTMSKDYTTSLVMDDGGP